MALTTFAFALSLALLQSAPVDDSIVALHQESLENQEKAHQAKLSALRASLRALDLDKEGDAAALKALVDEQRALCSDPSISGEIAALLVKADATLQAAKENEEAKQELADVEAAVRDEARSSADDLAQLRRKIDRLEPRLGAAGPDASSRLDAARKAAAHAYAARLHEEATEGIEHALEKYRRAEDGIRSLLERATREGDGAEQTRCEEIFRRVVGESDALATWYFDYARIEATPRQDLLSGDACRDWRPSEVKGFRHMIEGGAMQIVGPDADTKVKGIMSIGDEAQWRDLVVDMIVERSEGASPTLCLRLGRSVDGSVSMVSIDASDFPGRSIGSCQAVDDRQPAKFSVEGKSEPIRDEIVPWTRLRKGALGILVPSGCQVRFAKLEVRVLR